MKFLKTIDASVPAGLELHLICDNYGTHKTPEIKRWLLRHPRFQLHLTPTYSSWLNLVERWFAEADHPQAAPLGPSQRGRAGGRPQCLDPGVER